MSDIHYFGIRHHGPGSSKRLVAALDRLQPDSVLIEGPSDCSALLPLLAHQEMKPPVALLAYAAEQVSCSFYYPFAEFSPEYQACLWAIQSHADVAFIDVPASIQLAQMILEHKSEEDSQNASVSPDANEDADAGSNTNTKEPLNAVEPDIKDTQDDVSVSMDPIGTLAKLAGYEDGEAWWNDMIEQNCTDDQHIFATVESAMTELRKSASDNDAVVERDLIREAWMRLEINKYNQDDQKKIAVVCGAWHVPALKEKHTARQDRDSIKQLPDKLAASKIKTTWVPWTSPRLAFDSGYGAGVSAPMWYQHLWRQRTNPQSLEHWFGVVTQAMRGHGQLVSTASVIEAVRLSFSLAVVRNRPSPGFEEIREAIVACMCFGENLIWQQIEQEILSGNDVGAIPADAPLIPLLEDLQRQQKKYKLRPEALQSELALDLRSDTGLGKSVLLHRLDILGIPWGVIQDAGKSRGTFRERWLLCWKPEFSVSLVENLIYGSTIEQAANNKCKEIITSENQLHKLAETVQQCLEAQLNDAVELGLKRLDDQAGRSADCLEMLESIPPLVNISRYGTAREMSFVHVKELIRRLTTQAALALPYACRNLNDDESSHYRQCLQTAHQSVQLAELEDELMHTWWTALQTAVDSSQTSLLITGLCARLLYLDEKIKSNDLQNLLQKMLSPAVAAASSASFFDGFFSDAIQRLFYDQLLIDAVGQWLLQLEETDFIHYLPLFRRVFSGLDPMERKRLLDTILVGRGRTSAGQKINAAMLPLWPAHLKSISQLLQREKEWMK
jgi:hypothetical protein